MKLVAILGIFLFSIGYSIAETSSTQTLHSTLSLAAQTQSLGDQAKEFFSSLFDSTDWTPRWQNGNWSSLHGWLYIISDVIIWFSFFMIPLTLVYFNYRRNIMSGQLRSVLFLFITFILACGITHLIDAAIFWWPVYRFSVLIKLITAVFSLATLFALIKITPYVMEFKSPSMLKKIVEERMVEFQLLNTRLQNEIIQREEAEKKLKNLNSELEQKTKGLVEMNDQLIKREQDLLKSEEREKQLNADLEKKVEDRTAQLNNSNHELEAFTYSVSHDLRAPLRAIDGYARILEEDYNQRLDAHGKHLILVITRNAKYMGQLIDDLLEFSRTARGELIKTRFNTHEEVKKISGDLMTHEKNRKVEINLKKLDPCSADLTMLRQVWINLVSNALKYTRKKEEAKIEIGSALIEGEVQYYIKDNGVGFDMEYVDKLFGVFQRLHRKEEFEGTGVGLALVKRILDRHEGRIWAEASINNGATFYFTLPILYANE